MPERLLVYVDGFNLYHGMHDEYGHKYLWLDVVKLARALRPRSQSGAGQVLHRIGAQPAPGPESPGHLP